ncbi:AEC family transporter [Limnohabitans sp.]|uniref:AEC family transporter n=1 Tax=Limnohabitans sp. TaxID=1907725 RepID=UPI0038B9914E
MLNILTITAPIYLSIGTGYVATRSGFFSKLDMQVFGRFVLNFALPAMLFNALSLRDFQDVLHPRYLLAYALGSVMTFAIGFAMWRYGRRESLTLSALVGMGVSCSNSGYVGYPILLQILGPEAGVGMALTLLVENLIIIPLGISLADSGEAQHASWQHTVLASFRRLLKIPMLWAIVGGFVFSMMGWHLPEVLFKAVNLFALTCVGIALFVNGGSLVGMHVVGQMQSVAGIALCKLCLHPVLVGVMLWTFGGMDVSLQIAGVLLASMPMMGIYPILGQRHGQEGFCAAALLVTTVASFFSISLLLWGLSQVPGWHVATGG